MGFLLERHFWLIHAAVIAACAGYSGRISARLLGERLASIVQPRHSSAGAGEEGRRKDPAKIVERNIFCSTCPGQKPEGPQKGQRPGGVVRSTLPVELVSTMWAVKERRWSTALIRATGDAKRAAESRLYFVGQRIEGTDAEIARIDPRRVYLRRGGDRYEYLDLTEDPATPATTAAQVNAPAPQDALARGLRCTGDACDADRAFVESLLANPAPLFTQARFVPALRDNRPIGMRVYQIRPNSLFARLGLADGDCITSINGIELVPERLADAWVRLRGASHLRVSVERAGRGRTLDYRIL